MKIIKNSTTNVVIYAGDDLTLINNTASGDGWIHEGLTGYVIQDCNNIPANYVGSCFTYNNNVWKVIVGCESIVAEKDKELNKGLDTIKNTLWEQVKTNRDFRKFNGVLVSGKWFHTDTYSRTQWMGMMLMGANVPNIAWTTMDYTTIPLTQTLVQQVFAATAALDSQLFNKARDLYNQLMASSTPETVDITTGWTKTFGE